MISSIQLWQSVLRGTHWLGLHFRMPYQENEHLWRAIGYTGMGLFFSRFFVQWLYSEKHKESKVPIIFWWQSMAGAVVMLLYSLRQKDPVFILGYVLTVVPYSRNLILIYRKKARARAEASRGLLPRHAAAQHA